MRSHLLRAALALLAVGLIAESALAQQIPYQTMEVGMTPKKRELYFYGMRAYPFDRIPQNARTEAIYQAQTTLTAFASAKRAGQGTLSAVNTWKQIGPLDVSGRINAIVCHPTDGKTVWVGAADGGVWKSVDRGETWTPMMDYENAISMGALALDPKNPDVLYAGTGEMSSNIDAYTGAGILKSVDGGATWRPIGLANVGAFSKIVVHPTNSLIIFAGATKNGAGFYRSTDGGNTWKRSYSDPVSDITINPTNPNQIWIGTMAKGVFRSNDGGVTFLDKNSGLGQPGNTVGRISVQCAPSSPQTLYAGVHETNGTGTAASNYARIYRSVDGGDSWQSIYSGQDYLNLAGSPQGWYNNCLAVQPNNADVMIAGGIHIVKISDGGSSGNSYFINTYGGGPHPDEHALTFDPSNPSRVYLGGDGGMYRSEDAGQTYQRKSKGLAISQFYAMAVDQSAASVTYGGTQDNGTIMTTSTRAGDVLGGDGFYVCVDYHDANTVYAEQPNGVMYRINRANGAATQIMNGIDGGDEGPWSTPIVMDPINSTTLWTARHTVYATFDRGDNWIPTNLTLKGQGSAIGISKVNPNVVYVGSDRGEIFVSTDGGDHWADRSQAPGAPNRAVTDFVSSSTKAGTCYMVVSGFYASHVVRTDDYGETWTDIGGKLPDIPMNAIAVHPDDEKIIYVGSDIGMFITTDGGTTWAEYNNGLPRVAVADLEVHTSGRKLRMASHGRSMWEIDLEKPDLPPSILSPQGGEVWMAGTRHEVIWTGISGPVRVDYSLDNGQTWNQLITDVAALSWNVFDTSSAMARLRVTSVTDATKTATSRSFTIAKFGVGGTIGATQVTSIPYGLAFDGDFLYASDFGGNKLFKLDPNTLATLSKVSLPSTVGDSLFTDMAYNPKTGHFFMHKLNNTTDAAPGGQLIEIDKSGSLVHKWTSPCFYPIGLVFLETPTGDQLFVTDRNGSSQNMYFFDANNPVTPLKTVQRTKRVQYGPRCATIAPGGKSVYQVITDFTGEALQTAIADRFALDNQQVSCSIPLTSPIAAGYINARGIELDPRDSNLWISDYGGNIYKLISCDGTSHADPPPISGVSGHTIPDGMTLAQNLPNPFTTSTRISFSLPAAGEVSIAVYDERGVQVEQVAHGRYEAGTHVVDFVPQGLASGVYRCVYTLNASASISRSMVYVK